MSKLDNWVTTHLSKKKFTVAVMTIVIATMLLPALRVMSEFYPDVLYEPLASYFINRSYFWWFMSFAAVVVLAVYIEPSFSKSIAWLFALPVNVAAAWCWSLIVSEIEMFMAIILFGFVVFFYFIEIFTILALAKLLYPK